MEQQLVDIFGQTAYLILIGTTAAAMFFAMTAVRELQSHHVDGVLFLALALFFAIAHVVYLNTLPGQSPLKVTTAPDELWRWVNLYFAPALIVLFLLFGVYRMIADSTPTGLVKVFFGMTLLCYMYMVGLHWPPDVKGIIALVYTGAWFDMGLRTAA